MKRSRKLRYVFVHLIIVIEVLSVAFTGCKKSKKQNDTLLNFKVKQKKHDDNEGVKEISKAKCKEIQAYYIDAEQAWLMYKDRSEMKRLIRKAEELCSNGFERCCFILGYLTKINFIRYSGTGTDDDGNRIALALYSKACSLGYIIGCAAYDIYEAGVKSVEFYDPYRNLTKEELAEEEKRRKIVIPSLVKKWKIKGYEEQLWKRCKHKDVWACRLLGEYFVLLAGRGKSENSEENYKLAAKATMITCSYGHDCYSAATVVEEYFENEEEAQKIYKRICDEQVVEEEGMGEIGAACGKVALYYWVNEEKRNELEEKEYMPYYELACALGESCIPLDSVCYSKEEKNRKELCFQKADKITQKGRKLTNRFLKKTKKIELNKSFEVRMLRYLSENHPEWDKNNK